MVSRHLSPISSPLSSPVLALALTLALLAPAACNDGYLDKTRGGLAVEGHVAFGPRIIFDPLAKPVAEIPFPNDVILRPSDETVSGVAWNVAINKPSRHGTHTRRLLDELDGFGAYSPALVSFDGPIDLATVTEQTVMVVNIEPGHPREGERVPLDLGRGCFPNKMKPASYFGQDPNGLHPDLLFPESNVADVDGDGVAERVTHYEVSSNTLFIRPVMPLAPGARHAVLITYGVEGTRTDPETGATLRGPVRSPFPYKAHAAQAPFIRHALDVTGLDPAELAFGWTYTTSDVTRPLNVLREGLYGRGVLGRMAAEVPSGIVEVRDTGIAHDADGVDFEADPHDSRFILQAQFFSSILDLLATIQDDDNFILSFDHVDYVVFGSIESPEIRDPEWKTLALDTVGGGGEVTPNEIPFFLSVPKTTDRWKPPFPVMFYFHGTGTSRLEVLPITDAMARQGIAVMSFDEVGHGPFIPNIPQLIADNPEYADLAQLLPGMLAGILVPDEADEYDDLTFEEGLERLYEIGLFAELAVYGRSEDVNGDGRMDPAEAFFSADPFRLCASFWQDIVDLQQLVKTVRELDQAAVPATPLANPADATYDELKPYLLAGDFNADGTLDIGGPDVFFGMAGTSLGGFHSVMAAAMEPEITTVTPIVAGGGLTDIMLRSSLRFITQQLFLDVFGTVIVGCPGADGRLYLSQGNDADECKADLAATAFAETDPLPAGTEVVLLDIDNGERAHALVNAAGGFALAVEADRGDTLRVILAPDATDPVEIETLSKWQGSGYERNTKDFSRIVAIQQHVFDRCDPINFARHLFWEPLPGHPPTNVLLFNAVGDTTVPISTGLNLAMATGALGKTRQEWEPRIQALIDAGVFQGDYYDADDILHDNPPEAPAIGVAPSEPSPTGVSSIRLADVNGKHEWIAGYNKKDFEHGLYSQHQLALYHRCQGRVIVDDDPRCLETTTCPVLDAPETIPGCFE